MKIFSSVLALISILFLTTYLAQPISAADVTVQMTSDGFIPSEVTLSQGDTVIFINKDNTAHWPASDIHPTHTIYPEFDSLKAIAPDQSWQFQPQLSGSFKFHDHLSPHKKGTLIINQSAGYKSPESKNIFTQIASTIGQFFSKFVSLFKAPSYSEISIDKFKNLGEKNQYLAIDQMITQQGVEKTWQFILNGYRLDSTRNVHDIAHYIGGKIYQKQGIEGISICTADFAFGCFHGFTEVASLQGVDRLKQVADSCLKVSAKGSGPYISCVHGVGHGVATYYQTTDLDQSLATCETLDTEAQAPYCYDGVFMEFALNASASFYKKVEDKIYPCNQIDPKYHIACARYIPVVSSRVHKLEFSQIAALCMESTSENIKLHCSDALGFDAAAKSQGDPQVINTLCTQITVSNHRTQCLSAAAGEYAFQKIPNWQTKAPEVCNYLMTKEDKNSCLQRVERIKQSYGI